MSEEEAELLTPLGQLKKEKSLLAPEVNDTELEEENK